MSSDLYNERAARNLSRVNDFGYRENVQRRQQSERDKAADRQIHLFQAGITGAGITLSRFCDTIIEIGGRTPSQSTQISHIEYSLSERRDIEPPSLA